MAFLELGVRDWRIVFAGVDDGDGILGPDEGIGGMISDATVSGEVTFALIFDGEERR